MVVNTSLLCAVTKIIQANAACSWRQMPFHLGCITKVTVMFASSWLELRTPLITAVSLCVLMNADITMKPSPGHGHAVL